MLILKLVPFVRQHGRALPGLPLALCRLDRPSCRHTFFAPEQLSFSACEREQPGKANGGERVRSSAPSPTNRWPRELANRALVLPNLLIDQDCRNQDNSIERYWLNSVESFHALAISRYGPVSRASSLVPRAAQRL